MPYILQKDNNNTRRLADTEKINLIDYNISEVMQIKVISYSEVNPDKLTFSPYFKEWEDDEIKIGLNFTDPLYLSNWLINDQLKINISDPKFFRSKKNPWVYLDENYGVL